MERRILRGIAWGIFVACLATAVGTLAFVYFYQGGKGTDVQQMLFFSSSMLAYMGYLTLKL